METRQTAPPKLFIGIDIHKRSWKVHCATDISGGKTFSMEPRPVLLRDYVLRLRQFRFMDKELRDVSTQLRGHCNAHYKKDYLLLRSIPGIGKIVACGILCELGDLRRFRSLKHLAGYVGIAPGIHQSGDNLRTTGITRRAHRLIRSYFIEASWQAVRTDPVMQAYYRRHRGKNEKSIIVKVARKLLSRSLAVIKTETPWSG